MVTYSKIVLCQMYLILFLFQPPPKSSVSTAPPFFRDGPDFAPSWMRGPAQRGGRVGYHFETTSEKMFIYDRKKILSSFTLFFSEITHTSFSDGQNMLIKYYVTSYPA